MHILIKIMADFVFVVVIIWALIVMLKLAKDIRTEYIVRGIITGVVAEGLGQVAGTFYHHAPPFVAQHIQPLAWHINNVNSFPSDHMMLVSAATFVAWASTKNWKVGVPLLILSLIVGVGRVMAHVHWPIDIVASFIIAGVVTLVIYNLPYRSKRPLHTFRLK